MLNPSGFYNQDQPENLTLTDIVQYILEAVHRA